MSIDLPVNLQPDGFGASLQALQSHLQGFLAEYEDKVAQARAQLAHVEALLGSLPAEAPKAKGKKKEAVVAPVVVAPVIAEVPKAPTKGRKPKAVAAKPEAAPVATPAAKGKGRGHRRGSLTTRPAYEGLTLTESIEKILNERQGQAVNADDVVNILYGDLPETVFRVAKERVTKNLSKGKGENRWKRVPNQLGYYTLSLESLKTVPTSTIKRGRGAAKATTTAKAEKAATKAPKAAAKATKAPKAAAKATKAPKAAAKATKAPKAAAKATTVAAKAAPKASKKAEATASKAPQAKKSGRLSSLAFRPLYQGNTLTDAIEKVLQERKGEFVNADSVVKALYGDLSVENFRQAKDRVTKNLSKGKLDGKWERVPNQLGYYTLSMSAVKA
ncbi:hypothetical protein [Pseudanabaena sp. Chao 1811]|uniref:hypothetical protein n=1 Tax=Pseudanabaena sp. Chao 1811 TaxID=2963092 RepID=UPI0022F3AADF|nr:hypothetical protein [Pseudanabaena sp. Chao 1811]